MRRFWSLWQSLAVPSLARHHQMASALVLVPDQLGPRLRAGKPIIWQREALDGATVMSQAAFFTVVCQDNPPFSVSAQTREKTWRRFLTHLPIRFPFMPASDNRNGVWFWVFPLFLLPQRFIQTQGHPHVAIIKRMEIKSSCKSGYWMCKKTFQASEHPAEIVCDIKANGFSPIWLCCCNYSTGITAQMPVYRVHLLNNEKTTWHLPLANTAKLSSGVASEHCGGWVLTYRERNHFTYTLIDA